MLSSCCTSPNLTRVSKRTALSVNCNSTFDAGTSMQKSKIALPVFHDVELTVMVARQ